MGAPTRYPLAWPEGWKRTQSYQRKTATFSRQGKALTVFDGVQRVLDELQRLTAACCCWRTWWSTRCTCDPSTTKKGQAYDAIKQ